MSNTTNQTTDAQLQQENVTTQIQNKVGEIGGTIKETVVNTFSKKEEPEPEPRAFGEMLDDTVEGTKAAINNTIHETFTAPAGETVVHAGEALKEQSKAWAPPPEEKTLVEKVKDHVDSAKHAVQDGLSSLTGGKPEAEAKEEAAPKTVEERMEESKQVVSEQVAQQLSKAGDALIDAGERAKSGSTDNADS